MTPEQRAACQADVDRVVAELGHDGAKSKVRLEPPWTDPETGEEFGESWVAAVRIRRGSALWVVTVDAGPHPRDPGTWCDLLRRELQGAFR